MELNEDNYLIVGLGNPGLEYKHTRHNFGFMTIEHLAGRLNVTLKRMKFKAMIAETRLDGKLVVLAKPLTFMNDSGNSVGPLTRYFKVPLGNLLVMHDDLDLPLGSVRLRPQGGSSGQRGMASIINRLGTQEFPRMRLGIGRPPGQMDPVDYVLQPFQAQEVELKKMVLDQAADAAETFIRAGIEAAMNKYNGEVG
ncbi:MAG: aminoacyl-tRNA hydrolase [Anaerolineaceae bacterium]|nr:aminoacyl-tRNA hydrolase [Anaerolineaceae bacterium]HNX46591.1 aminoacyl-tRNA hydrolase [Anaerolineaceae bacterium]HPT23580.1 aminoacyl-tRNA hydrolase [Anaerolineaceae bacterium]